MEYCAWVWACCREVNSRTLEALQKHVGRIVIKTPSSITAMEAIKWPSLRSKHNDNILKLMRKCIDSWCPQYFNNNFVFKKYICTHSTQQSNLFVIMELRFLIVIVTVKIHKLEDFLLPWKLGFYSLLQVYFSIFLLLFFDTSYCVFYGLRIISPGILLIAEMLCKLPEGTTL